MQKKIAYIINPAELGAGTRGASLGPAALQVAARKNGSTLFADVPQYHITEVNHLLDKGVEKSFAKNIDGVLTVYESLTTQLQAVFSSNHFPIVLAGDHSSAGGTIAGITAAHPDKTLGIVWIDAHSDLHSPYTTPSGNIHGMPLATALAEDNLACKSNEVDQETIAKWNQLKNCGKKNPKLLAENLVFVAVRDTEEQEDAIISRKQIRNFKVAELRQKGVAAVTSEILSQLNNCDIIYISFDVDSMDPDITSHGTGTPVPNGLLPDEAKNLILNLLESPKVVCFEMVEINPCLDEKKNLMAETGFNILQKVVNKITKG